MTQSITVNVTPTMPGFGTLKEIYAPGEEGGYANAWKFVLDDNQVFGLPASWRFNAYEREADGKLVPIWPITTDADGNEHCEITIGMKVKFTRYWAFTSDGEPLWSTDANGDVRTDENGRPYHLTYTDFRCAEGDFEQAALDHARQLIADSRKRFDAWQERQSQGEDDVPPWLMP